MTRQLPKPRRARAGAAHGAGQGVADQGLQRVGRGPQRLDREAAVVAQAARQVHHVPGGHVPPGEAPKRVMPARRASRITSASERKDCERKDCACVMRGLARWCVALADITRSNASARPSMALSAPRAWGTRAVYPTPGAR